MQYYLQKLILPQLKCLKFKFVERVIHMWPPVNLETFCRKSCGLDGQGNIPQLWCITTIVTLQKTERARPKKWLNSVKARTLVFGCIKWSISDLMKCYTIDAKRTVVRTVGNITQKNHLSSLWCILLDHRPTQVVFCSVNEWNISCGTQLLSKSFLPSTISS